MIGSLTSFLDSLRIEFIIIVSILYLISMWVLIPIWVYFDAKKKYEQKYVPYLLFFLILPLNIPALIIYFIIRPERDDYTYTDTEEHVVSVPLVKFLNNTDDFVMSFDLSINGNMIKEKHRPNLNMKVQIIPDEETIILEEKVSELDQVKFEENTGSQTQLGKKVIARSLFSKLKTSLQKNFKEIKGFFILEDNDDSAEADVAPATVKSQKSENLKKKKKKGKKRK